jgi:hypothetical protein
VRWRWRAKVMPLLHSSRSPRCVPMLSFPILNL